MGASARVPGAASTSAAEMSAIDIVFIGPPEAVIIGTVPSLITSTRAMRRFSSTDVALAVMRLGYAALLFGFHGWARFFKAWNFAVMGAPWPFVAVVGRLGFPFAAVFAVLSALSESLGALCIGAGLFTRWAAA